MSRVLPFTFAPNANVQNVPSRLHLGTKTLPYVNTTLALGMRDLWAVAVVSGRFLSLMSRFSGAACPQNSTAVWYRIFIAWPCRHRKACSRTEIGAKAFLPDPSLLDGRSPLGWFRAPARNPLWRSTGCAKMRYRCVARVNNCETQTQHEDVGGFEGRYVRQALKQRPPVRS